MFGTSCCEATSFLLRQVVVNVRAQVDDLDAVDSDRALPNRRALFVRDIVALTMPP
jgi:hypothetical protein